MHHSSFIRITALSIVINPASNPTISSSLFPIDILQVLQQVLPYFQTETNAKFRDEYLVVIKSLFAHVRRGLIPLSREQISHANGNSIVEFGKEEDSTLDVSRTQTLSEKNATFLEWFDEFLINELHPCASYQRHITALKALLSLGVPSQFKNGVNKVVSANRTDEEFHNISSEYFLGFQLFRLLLDLIMDPFDDVRSAAALLLGNLLSNVDSTNRFFNYNISIELEDNEGKNEISNSRPLYQILQNLFISTIDRARSSMACTGRADHADGFGRLCQLRFDFYKVINTFTGINDRFSVFNNLLSSLSEDIKGLQDNFSFAVGNSSLHGNLIALRCVILNSSAGFATTDS